MKCRFCNKKFVPDDDFDERAPFCKACCGNMVCIFMRTSAKRPLTKIEIHKDDVDYLISLLQRLKIESRKLVASP